MAAPATVAGPLIASSTERSPPELPCEDLPRLPPVPLDAEVRLDAEDLARVEEREVVERDFDLALLEEDLAFAVPPLRDFVDRLALFEPPADFPPALRFLGLVLVWAMNAFLEFSRGNPPGGKNRSSGLSHSYCVDCGIG